MTTETAATAKRQRKTEIKFFDSAGNATARPGEDTAALEFTMKGEGTIRHQRGDYPAGMENAVYFFGVKELFSNSAAKGLEAISARDDNLRNGVWTEAGGDSVSVLAEAVFEARKAKGQMTMKNGEELTLAAVAALIVSVQKAAEAGDESAKKRLSETAGDPAVKVHIERIKLERQRARLAKAEEALANGEGETDIGAALDI